MVQAGSGALGQSGDSFRGPTVVGTGQVSLWFPLKVPGDPGFFHLYPHSWPSCVRPVLQHQHWLFLFPAVFSQHPVLTVGRVAAEGGGSRSPKGRRVGKV